jgi:hypothetical protein
LALDIKYRFERNKNVGSCTEKTMPQYADLKNKKGIE